MAWGGPEEQRKEHAAGNPNAKDWCDEALKIVEKTMEEYWEKRSTNPSMRPAAALEKDTDDSDTLESEFDRHRRMLLSQSGGSDAGGWAAELRRYLGDLPVDVTKDTDIVVWWAVSIILVPHSVEFTANSIIQKHCEVYPTLASIAKDICAVPATSVPCERLFSAGAEIATDRRSRLGADKFEHLQILKHAWRSSITDHSMVNSQHVTEIAIEEYRDFLIQDDKMEQWDKDGEIVTEY
jgi:hypothetical protein